MKKKRFELLTVGDLVQVRTWEGMLDLKNAVLDDDGDISFFDKKSDPFTAGRWICFTQDAESACGKILKVVEIRDGFVYLENYGTYRFSRKMLENKTIDHAQIESELVTVFLKEIADLFSFLKVDEKK